MELPQHWTTVDGFSPHLGEHGGTLTVWGWSTESEADAARVARDRLADALARIAVEGKLPPGRGYYPRMPLREPVLEEVEAGSGALLAVVTRNRMGCEVLCTDFLFVADVDVPGLEDVTARSPGSGVGSAIASGLGARRGEGVGGFFRRLLSGDPAPTPMTPADEPDADAASLRRRLRPDRATPASPRAWPANPCGTFAQRHPELGVRVYRTAAGLRVIVTGASAPPSSDRARTLLTELGSDPLYVELCSTHDSYRARLTPKPFRIGQRALAVRWPFADDGARAAAQEWVAEYDARAAGFAVCRLISASGPVPGPDEQRLVALHDARCRVGERLPLA